jgi:hypothetical protein
MPRDYAEPEIIPPGEFSSRERSSLSDNTLERLAALLDDAFVIPGTDIRFGLDPLIGLVPGIGDLISSLASFLIIHAAWQRKLSKATVARMVANVAIDTLVGAIPILGDTFDLAWKSNRKNLTLLQRATSDSSGRQSWRDWLFLFAVVIVLLLLVAIPIAMVSMAVYLLRRR